MSIEKLIIKYESALKKANGIYSVSSLDEVSIVTVTIYSMLINDFLADLKSLDIEALKEPEIIRCKDCVYRYTTFCKCSIFEKEPYAYTEWTNNDDFCSYGERR